MAAPKTVLTYPLNGTSKDFSVPFEYLARRFVVVTLRGATRRTLVLNSDYRFTTKTSITTTTAWGPAQGYDSIEISRVTSATERLVNFADGSILRAYDLNISQIQALHIAEEARDLSMDALGGGSGGVFNAGGKRITAVGTPTGPTDAATKDYVDTFATRPMQAAVRGPLGETLTTLPAAAQRASKILAFDAFGQPTVLLPQEGSAGELGILLADSLNPENGAGRIGYLGSTVAKRLNRTIYLEDYCQGGGLVDDTEGLLEVFSRSNVTIDAGSLKNIWLLRHDTLLALVGENRLQVRDGVRIIGQGRVNILSNQLADGTRIELTGDRCYVGEIEIREINATLGRYSYYGALSARSATNFAIDRTRITGSNGAAIHIRNNCQNFLVRRPYIRNSKSDGLHIQRGSRDFSIDHPDIREVEDDCIGIVGHGKDEGYAAPSNGVIVGGYYGEQQNGAVGSGIALIGCHDIQVIQPIIRKTGLSGIRIAEERSDGLYTPRNITIVAPDIDRTGLTSNLGTNLSKEGIFISAGYKIDIINPKIQRAGTHGIAVSGPNVDVHIYEPTITDSGSRGMWLTSSSGSGDMVTEIWGDDPRGAGASQVRNEYLRLIRPRIDRSGTDGFYLDGTSGAFVEPELTDVKVRRSNMGGTANKYGIFLKDANGVCYSGLDAGSSGSGTALLTPLQFAGANTTGTTGFIDNIQTRLTSLTIPLQSKYGIREFWNTAFPAAPTGVEGGYKVAETIRNPNPSNGVVRWVCTVAGDPGVWVAK